MGRKGEPGRRTTKALRWDHVWYIGEQQGGDAAEMWRKEGSKEEARGCRSGLCPPSEHHCCVNPGTRLPSSPFKAGETEALGK